MDDKLEELKVYLTQNSTSKKKNQLKPSIILLMISKKRSLYKYKPKSKNDVKK